MKENFWQLILITNKGKLPTDSYLEFVALCVKAGVTSVQLREKNLSRQAHFHFGQSLKAILNTTHTPLIINDDVDLCLELDVAGVHLGQSDGDPIIARKRLGPSKYIGLSVNTFTDIEKANNLPVDYLGLGAVFPTNSKQNIKTIWGLDGLKQASLMSTYPIIALGGIDESNVVSVIKCGASGVAAICAFHEARNPYRTAKNLINLITHAQ